MAWSLSFTSHARRQLRGLARRDRDAIGSALDRLVRNPGDTEFSKLGGRWDQWRLRVGRYRRIVQFLN